jgi:hypothetical protein
MPWRFSTTTRELAGASASICRPRRLSTVIDAFTHWGELAVERYAPPGCRRCRGVPLQRFLGLNEPSALCWILVSAKDPRDYEFIEAVLEEHLRRSIVGLVVRWPPCPK